MSILVFAARLGAVAVLVLATLAGGVRAPLPDLDDYATPKSIDMHGDRDGVAEFDGPKLLPEYSPDWDCHVMGNRQCGRATTPDVDQVGASTACAIGRWVTC